jgi:hypothetical protein
VSQKIAFSAASFIPEGERTVNKAILQEQPFVVKQKWWLVPPALTGTLWGGVV